MVISHWSVFSDKMCETLSKLEFIPTSEHSVNSRDGA